MKRTLFIALLAFALMPVAAYADHRGSSWGIGFSYNCAPRYTVAPVYSYPTYTYVSPTYVAPAPVYVASAPVYVAPAPVVVTPSYNCGYDYVPAVSFGFGYFGYGHGGHGGHGHR